MKANANNWRLKCSEKKKTKIKKIWVLLFNMAFISKSPLELSCIFLVIANFQHSTLVRIFVLCLGFIFLTFLRLSWSCPLLCLCFNGMELLPALMYELLAFRVDSLCRFLDAYYSDQSCIWLHWLDRVMWIRPTL